MTKSESNGPASANAAAGLLEAALRYARFGFHVFPCCAGGKKPIEGSGGLKDATRDETRIRRFWAAHPDANVAIRTGEPSALVVIDIDGQEARTPYLSFRTHTATGGSRAQA